MRIKEVCEKTGLTDRAVRFYIENELIHPDYTENYTGRKSYDFSEKDLFILKQIATFRKYDFSIEEVSELLKPEGDVQKILEEHIAVMKTESQRNIDSIEQLVNGLNQSPWTPEELCASLNKSALEPRITINDNDESEEQLAVQKKRDSKVTIISAATILLSIILLIILTYAGVMNETVFYILFTLIGLAGYGALKNAFKYLKPNHQFKPYLIVMIVIYLLGFIFGRYII